MSMTLYEATVPSCLQIVESVSGLLDKAEAWTVEHGLPAEDITHARLAADMKPFSYQITSVCHHSAGAFEGLRAGVFSPDTSDPPEDFAALRERLETARSALDALSGPEVEAFLDGPMRFEFGEYRIDFTAQDFLLSFSQPNFYFHATTAYDILRWKGLPLGKLDFLGRTRTS